MPQLEQEKEKLQPLDTTVRVKSLEDYSDNPELRGMGTWVVIIGNTGLSIIIKSFYGETTAEAHFKPEGNTDPTPDGVFKYSRLFCSALNVFFNWWQSQKELPHFTELKGSTGKIMSEFRQHLLGEKIYSVTKVFNQGELNEDHLYTLSLVELEGDQVRRVRIAKLAADTMRKNYLVKQTEEF